ncbi:MAG: hypothetical protein AAB820_02380 [Patescibacteria group bacterium]
MTSGCKTTIQPDRLTATIIAITTIISFFTFHPLGWQELPKVVEDLLN